MLPNVLGHKNMFINKNKVFSGLTVNDAKIAIYNTSLKSHGEVNVVATIACTVHLGRQKMVGIIMLPILLLAFPLDAKRVIS